jgi:hypothetical protein
LRRLAAKLVRGLGGGRLAKESSIHYDREWNGLPNQASVWKMALCLAVFTTPTRRPSAIPLVAGILP